MLKVHSFAFNPFSENTYIVYDEQGNCIIFDPGMYDAYEQKEFSTFINENLLKPQYLINTHCHIDHIMGNTWVSETYGLSLHAHALEKGILEMGRASANLYGLQYQESIPISHFIDTNDVIMLGKHRLEILFTPGHSPGSLSFYNRESNFAIVGDVLFKNSIGRTDLPGGDFETLISSIRTQLFTLADNTIVYNGHGPSTEIGTEKIYNPFLHG
ncbi:MAG: MBL fold metallo-hydrolase [Bacteroidia bacterium]|nr:MBL fold metallo-hydrolase [Bacteroidia bacterium]